MAATSKTVTAVHVRRASAPRVSLAARAHIDMAEKGLTSVAGAREVIAAIRARKSVSKLILSHNNLGDYGCQELFQYLNSEGRHYQIVEILLKSNDVGGIGLDAIASYLVDNRHLKTLNLQANHIEGSAELGIKLAIAINTSRLETLSLVANSLTDDFCISFFLHLGPSDLKDIQLGHESITRSTGLTLIDFISSPRSRSIETFKCNGANLGVRTVQMTLQAAKKLNFTVQKLELFAFYALEDSSTEGVEISAEEIRARWENIVQLIKQLLIRNELLKKRVQEHALALLAHARPLLVSSSRRDISRTQTPAKLLRALSDPSAEVTHKKLSQTQTIPSSSFKFHALPVELQQHILSFLAPALSPSQRIRIFDYASTPATLKPLLQLPGPDSIHSGCIPDPATLPFSGGATPSTLLAPLTSPSLPSDAIFGLGLTPITPSKPSFRLDQISRMNKVKSSPCAGGKCLGAGGSVWCHRYETRLAWLKEVGCVQFDAAGRTEEDVLQLLATTASIEGSNTNTSGL